MSELLRIRTVSSRSKLETLREFGHRSFIEIADDGKPIGYFVETKEAAGISTSKSQPGRRTPVQGKQALMWSGKTFKCKRPESTYAKLAQLVRDLTALPVRRDELVEQITKLDTFTSIQATNGVSKLTIEGYLVVPG